MANKFEKKYFYTGLSIFLASILFGAVIGFGNIASSEQAINRSVGYLDAVKNWSNLLIFLFIFFNNAIKALIAILLGFFFALYPIYFIASNGFLLGLFYAVTAKKEGAEYFFAGTLPHGLFELFAIILASSYGIWIGTLYYKKWIKKEEIDTKAAFKYCWQKYYKIILPILLLAALIETFVTPMVMSHFQK